MLDALIHAVPVQYSIVVAELAEEYMTQTLAMPVDIPPTTTSKYSAPDRLTVPTPVLGELRSCVLIAARVPSMALDPVIWTETPVVGV